MRGCIDALQAQLAECDCGGARLQASVQHMCERAARGVSAACTIADMALERMGHARYEVRASATARARACAKRLDDAHDALDATSKQLFAWAAACARGCAPSMCVIEELTDVPRMVLFAMPPRLDAAAAMLMSTGMYLLTHWSAAGSIQSRVGFALTHMQRLDRIIIELPGVPMQVQPHELSLQFNWPGVACALTCEAAETNTFKGVLTFGQDVNMSTMRMSVWLLGESVGKLRWSDCELSHLKYSFAGRRESKFVFDVDLAARVRCDALVNRARVDVYGLGDADVTHMILRAADCDRVEYVQLLSAEEREALYGAPTPPWACFVVWVSKVSTYMGSVHSAEHDEIEIGACARSIDLHVFKYAHNAWCGVTSSTLQAVVMHKGAPHTFAHCLSDQALGRMGSLSIASFCATPTSFALKVLFASHGVEKDVISIHSGGCYNTPSLNGPHAIPSAQLLGIDATKIKLVFAEAAPDGGLFVFMNFLGGPSELRRYDSVMRCVFRGMLDHNGGTSTFTSHQYFAWVATRAQDHETLYFFSTDRTFSL